jgi:hypothetical protein
MASTYGRFGIHVADDTDAPNFPAQQRAELDDVQARLGYAGAQGGKSIVTASQSITSAALALAPTPDRVQGIVIENDGDLLFVHFSALLKHGSSFAAAAAIVLTKSGVDTELALATAAAAPTTAEAFESGSDPGQFRWVYTDPATGGLQTLTGAGATDPTAVTTGMTFPNGGPVCIERLAAGTYDVSVRWSQSGGGTATIKDRRLAVWTREFPTSGV